MILFCAMIVLRKNIQSNWSGSAGVQPDPEATDRLTEGYWLIPPFLAFQREGVSF